MKKTSFGDCPVIDIKDRFPYVRGRYYDSRHFATITTLVVHHTGDDQELATPNTALARLDAIHRWHTTGTREAPGEPHPWPAIGYHLAIDAAGTIYWCNSLGLISYHAREVNRTGIGVVWLGDFSSRDPDDVLYGATRDLRRGLEKHLGHELALVGHYEVQLAPTTCPGKHHWPTSKGHITTISDILSRDVETYAIWVRASLLASSTNEVRGEIGLMRFRAHLQGIGKDRENPYKYGWPCSM